MRTYASVIAPGTPVSLGSDEGLGQSLLCPYCLGKNHPGVGVNLHQGRVTVASSDEATVVPGVLGDDRPVPNPRGGLVIDFECESCRTLLQLNIFQHKGTTHVRWSALSFEPGKPEHNARVALALMGVEHLDYNGSGEIFIMRENSGGSSDFAQLVQILSEYDTDNKLSAADLRATAAMIFHLTPASRDEQ